MFQRMIDMSDGEWAVIDLYANKRKSMNYIYDKLGISSPVTTNILNKFFIPIRTRNATREVNLDRDTLYQLYIRKQMSCRQIADHLGISNGSVHNHLKKHGLNNRSAAQAKAGTNYSTWDESRLERCRELLLEHRSYQVVAELLGCTSSAVENKNCENWQIPMSIWAEREDEVRAHLEQSRNYAETADHFDLSETALVDKNHRSWHIDLSMNSTLFGIPTEYNGTLYRSKKESFIAKYLTEKGIEFEYERTVKPGHNWTCDFYLPEFDLWVEYDGLEAERKATKSTPYNRDNPKVRFYQENGFRHIILGKRTWKKQLDKFFGDS